jgi:DNA-binding NarL/FixJ family response regulator
MSDSPESGCAPLRVMVIDDHVRFARLLTDALNREPDVYCVGHAGSMAAGVEMCLTLKPEVVVMDYHLGDGDGLTASGQILAREPKTRIIILTGDPSLHLMERAADLGVCAFLPKGVSLTILLQTLRRAAANPAPASTEHAHARLPR